MLIKHMSQKDVSAHMGAMALNDSIREDAFKGISAAIVVCHGAAVSAGWWTDLRTGECLLGKRNQGEMLCLIHSEISEALEGVRKDKMDDHLPHRKAVEVELADALIRIFDFAGAHSLDLPGAFAEKLAYNAQRADHKPKARLAANGKAF